MGLSQNVRPQTTLGTMVHHPYSNGNTHVGEFQRQSHELRHGFVNRLTCKKTLLSLNTRQVNKNKCEACLAEEVCFRPFGRPQGSNIPSMAFPASLEFSACDSAVQSSAMYNETSRVCGELASRKYFHVSSAVYTSIELQMQMHTDTRTHIISECLYHSLSLFLPPSQCKVSIADFAFTSRI